MNKEEGEFSNMDFTDMKVIQKPDKYEQGTSDQLLPLFHLTRQIKDHVENYSQDMQIKIYGPILHYCLKMYSELEVLNRFLINLNTKSNEAINV
jgi:hypothetical protein